jgi:hypothetical protein
MLQLGLQTARTTVDLWQRLVFKYLLVNKLSCKSYRYPVTKAASSHFVSRTTEDTSWFNNFCMQHVLVTERFGTMCRTSASYFGVPCSNLGSKIILKILKFSSVVSDNCLLTTS